MKKTRVLALALIVALVLLGAGYAAWTDQLTIKNTVNTGKMNVEFIDVTESNGGTSTTFLPYLVGLEMNGKYLDTEISKDDAKTITVKVKKLYPGSGALYAVRFQNNGSIPAVIDKVEVDFTKHSKDNILEQKLVTVGGFVQRGTRNGRTNSYVAGNIFPSLDYLLENLPDLGESKIYLKDLGDNLTNMLKGRTMQPGDYITLDIPETDEDGNPTTYKETIKNVLDSMEIEGFDTNAHNCVIMGLPKNKNVVENDLQDREVEFQIRIIFKQHNAPYSN